MSDEIPSRKYKFSGLPLSTAPKQMQWLLDAVDGVALIPGTFVVVLYRDGEEVGSVDVSIPL